MRALRSLWLVVALPCGLGCGPILMPADDASGESTTIGVSQTTGRETGSVDPSTTGDSTSAEESGLESSLFIVENDGGAASFECNPWTGEPCSPGEKCMPWDNSGQGAWNATKCTPIAPDPRAPGEPCTAEGSGVSGIDDCEAFSMCWNVDPRTNEGTCVPFCIGSEANATCADPCSRCHLTSSGALILCHPMCDPLDQNCPDGQGCYGYGSNFICAPDASGADAGHPGSPCEFLNVCQPGTFCAAAASVDDCTGSSGCCTPFCNLTDDTPCPDSSPGTECIPWYDEGTAPVTCSDLSRVGGCLLPD